MPKVFRPHTVEEYADWIVREIETNPEAAYASLDEERWREFMRTSWRQTGLGASEEQIRTSWLRMTEGYERMAMGRRFEAAGVRPMKIYPRPGVPEIRWFGIVEKRWIPWADAQSKLIWAGLLK